MHRLRATIVTLACFIALSGPAAASGGKISLNVRDVDVYTVLSMLALESGVNIVADNTTVKHDKVTISLHNVNFTTALRTIELADGLQDVQRNGVLFISTSDAIARRFSGGSGLQTRVFVIRNADATALASELGNTLPTGTIIVPDARTHGILITGDSQTIGRASQIIADLDHPLLGLGSNSAVVSRTILLHFIKPEEASAALQQALTIPTGSSVIRSADQNAVIVTGSQDLVSTAQAILGNLDQPGQQVIYEVRVVDLEPVNDTSNLGVQFGGIDFGGNPTQGLTTTTFAGLSLKINATINAMISHGHGQELATPRIALLNNHEGNLLVGETRPISFVNAQTGALQVQFIDIGVKLRLTPTIGSDGYVTTELHPEFSALIGVSAQGIPIISNRKVDSTLRVKDGESIVLAGLLQDISTTTVSKVPWLGDLPVFGGLFRDKSATHTHDEVVFIITPHIQTQRDIMPAASAPGLQP
jgi:type II secretory pathway component GspD/PulD (secretin)